LQNLAKHITQGNNHKGAPATGPLLLYIELGVYRIENNSV
jgi:hypothetical protein